MPALTTPMAPESAAQDSGINATDYYLWDFAGVDGLQAAIALFSPAINHIAPYQSLSTTFNQIPCSVLRLCENNFRVALSEKLAFDKEMDKKMGKEMDKAMDKVMDKAMDKKMGKKMGKAMDKKMDKAMDKAIAPLNLKVWCKPCPSSTLEVPTAWGLKQLPKIATTKPIYTLNPFPCDRAVPARINGMAILVWHHSWQGQPRLDIQTASKNINAVHKVLSSFDEGQMLTL